MKLDQYPSKSEFLELASQGNLVPVCTEVLADTQTPVSLLLKQQEKGRPVFLLESVEGGERWARYSFLGTGARHEVKVYGSHVEVSGAGETQRIDHQGDPLSVLRDVMARFTPVVQPRLPRFWGGMVGYMTYEMVSFFEKIENKLPPDTPIAHFMVTDNLFIFDNVRHTLTLVAHAFLDNGMEPEAAYEDARARLDEMLESVEEGPVSLEASIDPDAKLEPVRDPEDYKERVRRVKKYITDGDIIQSVISQPFVCKAKIPPAALYRAQRYVNPSPYMFFFQMDSLSLVGSSPETMVRLENGVATLRPIAGTRPRGKNQQEDRALANELLADPKERAEHLMLVDLGRNDLGRVARTGTVQVTDLMIVERYSHVMHLVSNITCDMVEETDGWDLVKATFPAGTLSGAPKVRAMEIISEMESSPRGPYGGAVGYVSFTGNMDLAITIRTAAVKDGVITVRAGAGIVADSDPDAENTETINKAGSIQRAIELVKQ